MRTYCLTLDLIDDPALIKAYEEIHQEVWPEIQESILSAGINAMQIYRYSNRLFMIMEVGETFSFDKKTEMDVANDKVQQWETLMWKYQQAVPGAKPGEKWVMMNRIFELKA
ncbi:L-rhamnose mutarotase [Pedobacter metabolipauper]|uniref:L-rhamnose mutarotase n=1 Tax=Pedobacter metabolipauper TaxID=425513 RepID=A0A4R6SVQ7_9SPHI|nr:L-rhamnose mutarotase [Pedobacter metabolipauper]TDQ09880.1 L-rhamnose mutarotase [Pedobacter metabolipauper]